MSPPRLSPAGLGPDRFRIAGTAEFNGYNLDIRAPTGSSRCALVAAAVPGVSTATVIPWAGLRPMTPNMMPRVGRGKPCGHLLQYGTWASGVDAVRGHCGDGLPGHRPGSDGAARRARPRELTYAPEPVFATGPGARIAIHTLRRRQGVPGAAAACLLAAASLHAGNASLSGPPAWAYPINPPAANARPADAHAVRHVPAVVPSIRRRRSAICSSCRTGIPKSIRPRRRLSRRGGRPMSIRADIAIG